MKLFVLEALRKKCEHKYRLFWTDLDNKVTIEECKTCGRRF